VEEEYTQKTRIPEAADRRQNENRKDGRMQKPEERYWILDTGCSIIMQSSQKRRSDRIYPG
jgi:hypothetical protein